MRESTGRRHLDRRGMLIASRAQAQPDVALKGGSKMMVHSRAAQTTILATGFAFVLLLAALDNHAHAEGNLDASYTISFARIRVGDLAATVVFGDKEYAISARGRAGGVMTLLIGHDTINRWRSLLHHARHRQGRSSRADNFYI
jgi:hypothetical protein